MLGEIVGPPRKHHYLPSFFQRNWAGLDGKVERFIPTHRDKLIRRRVSPNEAAFERDLYADPRHSPSQWSAQKLELELFQRIDSEAADALALLCSDVTAVSDKSVRRAWARFIRSMMHRTPTHLSATLALYDKIWHQKSPTTQEQYEKIRLPGFPEAVEDYLKALDPNIVRDTAFDLLFSSLNSDNLAEYMANQIWKIFNIEVSKFQLYLSDNPVILVPMKTPNGHVAIPLGPSQLLVITEHLHVIREISDISVNELARKANVLSVERACHCVIASDRAGESFIRNRFGRNRVGSLSDGFGSLSRNTRF